MLAALSLPVLAMVASCAGKASSPSPATVRLVDLYKPEMLRGSAPRSTKPTKRTEWRFDGDPPAPAPKEFAGTRGWEAGLGVSGLTIRDGRLTGRSTSEFPVLQIERTQDLDNRDQFHAIEIRMKVSAGQHVSVITRGPGPVPWDEVERGMKLVAWPMTVPAAPGSETQTYTFTSAAPINSARIRRILVRPTDVAGATFEIESVRLIYRKEYLADLPSGVSWQGLSEIYRESLVARAPERMTFDVTVPDRGWLDIGVGTIDDPPATFEVSVKSDGASAPEVIHRETVTTPHRWQRASIDLAPLAGRKVAVSLALTGEAGTIGLWGSPAIRSRSRDAAATSPDARPRGVVWIHADTLRPDHLTMYGSQRDTAPFLKQLASEGALFTRAMTQGTWTKASSSSFLTSLYPTTHGVSAIPDRLPASTTTIADVYRAAGYATVSYSSVAFTGQLTNLHKGFEEVNESTSQTDPVYTSKSAREYVDRAVEWIDAHKDGPFFMYLHVFDPHPPYEPRRPYDATWADPAGRDAHIAQRNILRKFVQDPAMATRGMATVEEMKAAGVDANAYLAYDKDWYDGAIRALDAEIARLVERLRAAGLDDKTAIVFMSDHGEEFQDHGRMWHGHSVYGELAHVPLFFRWPGRVGAGTRVDEVVQSIDIMPTLLDFSQLPHPPGIQGQSLAPLLAMKGGPPAAEWKRRPAITEKTVMSVPGDAPDPAHERDASWESVAINDGDWKLIRHTIRPAGRPEFELFDAKNDPLDQRDVAADHGDVVQRLARALDDWHQMAKAARLKPDAEATKNMTPEQLRRLKSLGYVK